ncbi:MAG: HAMP domain-containing protein [Anaerolineae bacterium]|nr:HAMP domain-containing protein [Anaerolineae bacterium]
MKNFRITFLKDLKIGRKLTLGFGILVVLTLAAVVFSYAGSIPATRNIERTNDVRFPTALAASEAQTDLLRMLGDVRGYLALGEDSYRASYAQARQNFEADLAELEQLSPNLSPENRQRLDQLQATFAEWSTLPEQLFELRDDQLEREPAYRLLATDGILLGGTVLLQTGQLIENQGRREATAENIALLADMAEFQGSFASMLSGLRGYVTTRNRAFIGEYEGNLAANQFAWERLDEQREQLTPGQQTALDTIAQNREEFLQLPDQMFEILESDRWREDLYLFSTRAVVLANEMQQLLAEMTRDQTELLERDLEASKQGLILTNQQTLVAGVFAIFLGVALAFIFWSTIAGPVRRLTGVAQQISEGDLEAQAKVESKDEIGVLARTFNTMTGRLRETLLQVRKEKTRADNLLEVVIPIGVELASEKDFNRLLEKMLLEAKSFCHADGGVLYLLTQDNRLEFVIVRHDTLNMAMGGSTGKDITYTQLSRPLALYDEDTGEPNYHTIATHVALTGASLNISDANQAGQFSGTEVFGRAGSYHTTSHLAIPLKDSQEKVLGVMHLVDAKDPERNLVIPFDQNLQQMMESFSSLAVAALEAYIREQNLRQEIQQLRIEIDEAKRQREVEEIVEADTFQSLRARARDLRRRRQQPKQDKPDEGESTG